MKKLAFLLVLIGLCVWPVGLRAQSAALMEAGQQGEALYQPGRYDAAEPLYKRALARRLDLIRLDGRNRFRF
jgi:hypothetical protein